MIEGGELGEPSRGPTVRRHDHVIESFRNRLGRPQDRRRHRAHAGAIPSTQEALATMGVVVWPMIELEADDALATRIWRQRIRKREGAIWTPDKDLAQRDARGADRRPAQAIRD